MGYTVLYMEQFDLNQIRNFVRLVQAGSFTKAAALLKQPKSRVSRHLSALEKELGLQLVYRTTRQFQLTEEGRIFYGRAKSLVEGLELLSTEILDRNSEVSGMIRITAADDMGVRVLPQILSDFKNLYPRIQFELLLSQAYVDLVKESVDLALRVGVLKDSSMKARKVGSMRNIFVAAPSFLERHKFGEESSALEKVPFLAMSHSPKVEYLKSGDGRKRTFQPHVVFSANNPAMLLQLAVLGKGLAFLPEFLCLEDLKTGKIVQVHKSLMGYGVPVSLVIPEQKEVPLRIKTFLDFATQRLKEIFGD